MSHRLASILDWVQTPVLADVGCDHAQIAVQAVISGRANRAYAMDVAAGPLENARGNIRKHHLEGQVIPILSRGLEHLPADTRQIVIAGMGGTLVCQILEEGKEKLNGSVQLILSVHKDAPLLRRWLLENGFAIRREKMILEGGHYYPLLQAEKGAQQADAVQLELGVAMEEDAIFARWLDFLEEKYRRILEQKEVPALREKLSQVLSRKEHLPDPAGSLRK